LNELRMQGNGIENVDPMCDALLVNTTLNLLDLSSNLISCKAALALIKTSEMQGLNIVLTDNVPWFEESDAKNELRTLFAGLESEDVKGSRMLELRHCGVRESAPMFFDAMKRNRSIRSLDLSWNQLSHLGATHLAQLLATDTVLEVLDLRDNLLGRLDAFPKSLHSCLEAHPNRVLKRLNLGNNCYTPQSSRVFFEAAPMLESLCELAFSNNDMSVAGASALAEALDPQRGKTFKRLGVLVLSSCNVGNVGFRALLSGMSANRTVKQLDCSRNGIECSALSTFGEMLSCNHVLEVINLSLNVIQGVGFFSIHQALIDYGSLSPLKTVNLCGNPCVTQVESGRCNRSVISRFLPFWR